MSKQWKQLELPETDGIACHTGKPSWAAWSGPQSAAAERLEAIVDAAIDDITEATMAAELITTLGGELPPDASSLLRHTLGAVEALHQVDTWAWDAAGRASAAILCTLLAQAMDSDIALQTLIEAKVGIGLRRYLYQSIWDTLMSLTLLNEQWAKTSQEASA